MYTGIPDQMEIPIYRSDNLVEPRNKITDIILNNRNLLFYNKLILFIVTSKTHYNKIVGKKCHQVFLFSKKLAKFFHLFYNYLLIS